jgi:hypothetical protein
MGSTFRMKRGVEGIGAGETGGPESAEGLPYKRKTERNKKTEAAPPRGIVLVLCCSELGSDNISSLKFGVFERRGAT